MIYTNKSILRERGLLPPKYMWEKRIAVFSFISLIIGGLIGYALG